MSGERPYAPRRSMPWTAPSPRASRRPVRGAARSGRRATSSAGRPGTSSITRGRSRPAPLADLHLLLERERRGSAGVQHLGPEMVGAGSGVGLELRVGTGDAHLEGAPLVGVRALVLHGEGRAG